MLVVLALFLVYWQAHGWKFSAFRSDLLWLGLGPLLLLAHLYDLYRVTGTFLAPFLAQSAWGRGKYGFLEGLRLQLEAPVLDVYKLDALFILLFLACGVYLLVKWPEKSLGVYTILMAAVPVSSGMLISASAHAGGIPLPFCCLGRSSNRQAASSWFAGCVSPAGSVFRRVG
jgi:hypothetical protein